MQSMQGLAIGIGLAWGLAILVALGLSSSRSDEKHDTQLQHA